MSTDRTPQLSDRLWHASGGVVWHWRAWHHGHRWQVFRAHIAALLQAWAPAERALLLVGPSAGWTLPGEFFQRFDQITAVEPDPLARWLLKRRFPELRPQWLSIDAFAQGGARALLEHCPGHAVLLCNVAGQVMPEDETDAAACCSSLREALAGRSWASYHDLVSMSAGDDPGCSDGREDGLRWHLPDTSLEDILASHGRRGIIALEDHRTAGLGRGLTTCTLAWPLRPDRMHLVQWVAVRVDEPPPQTASDGNAAVPGLSP